MPSAMVTAYADTHYSLRILDDAEILAARTLAALSRLAPELSSSP